MKITGSCACGAVEFEADGEPRVQVYCHCRSCQRAHAAPVVAAALFLAENVKVSGETRETTVTDRPDATRRHVCAKCGTKVFNQPVPQIRTIFPSLCADASWFAPTVHIQWQDHVVEVRDELPKYLDFPERMGGTGKLA